MTCQSTLPNLKNFQGIFQKIFPAKFALGRQPVRHLFDRSPELNAQPLQIVPGFLRRRQHPLQGAVGVVQAPAAAGRGTVRLIERRLKGTGINLEEQITCFDGLVVDDGELDDRTGDADNASVRFVHAAPDAPQVDVKTDAADGSAVFSGVAFKGITDYTTVPPDDCVFVVTVAGDTESAVVTFESVTIDAGGKYTIVALGTLDADDGYDFGVRVFIDSGDGNRFVDLTVAEY